MIKVVAALIIDANKCYICKRASHMSFPGYWEFPGGKVEEGETDEQALKREIVEELSCLVRVNELLVQTEYEYKDDLKVQLSIYECKLSSILPEINEHETAQWIEINKLEDYQFLKASEKVLPVIINNYS